MCLRILRETPEISEGIPNPCFYDFYEIYEFYGRPEAAHKIHKIHKFHKIHKNMDSESPLRFLVFPAEFIKTWIRFFNIYF